MLADNAFCAWRGECKQQTLPCALGYFNLSIKASDQPHFPQKMIQEVMNCFVNFSASVTMGTLVCQALPAHPCGFAGRELGETIKLTTQSSCQILLMTLHVPGQRLQDKLPCRETHWGILLPFLRGCVDGCCCLKNKGGSDWSLLNWGRRLSLCVLALNLLFSFCRLPRREESWIYYQLTWCSDYGHGTGY